MKDPRAPIPGWILALALPVSALPSYLPSRTRNPSFAPQRREILAELDRMERSPHPLERPVVVLAGWRSPFFVAAALRERLRRLTSPRDDDFLSISYATKSDIDAIADGVVERVRERWPVAPEEPPVEVDVVAHSMGGLVARLASSPDRAESHRLRVRRLFTLATPHRGAKLARHIAIDPASQNMRPGSRFLRDLDESLPSAAFELICYAHLNDRWVGASRTAPHGRTPIWTGGTRFFSHYSITSDAAILADIARRLRSEPPLAGDPSAPPRD